MRSRWFELKPNAVRLRKRGLSIGKIERKLGIPRSTLSGWFQNVQLSAGQKKKLHENWKRGLVDARKAAVLWHNEQKNIRLQQAKEHALTTLKSINSHDQNILELALAVLYLGEGNKKTVETAMGNSDPLLLNFFISVLMEVYNFDIKQIRCELGLRADQNPGKMKRYWSRELGLPLSCFKRVNLDKRTEGTKTYSHYKGVCQVRCGNVAMQRRLVYLGNMFIRQANSNFKRP